MGDHECPWIWTWGLWEWTCRICSVSRDGPELTQLNCSCSLSPCKEWVLFRVLYSISFTGWHYTISSMKIERPRKGSVGLEIYRASGMQIYMGKHVYLWTSYGSCFKILARSLIFKNSLHLTCQPLLTICPYYCSNYQNANENSLPPSSPSHGVRQT